MDINKILVKTEVATIHACSCGAVKIWYGNIGIKFDKAGFIHFAIHLDSVSDQFSDSGRPINISTGPLQLKLQPKEFNVFNRAVQDASLKLVGWSELLEQEVS